MNLLYPNIRCNTDESSNDLPIAEIVYTFLFMIGQVNELSYATDG